MNRFLKTLTGAFCTVSILLGGVTVFAADDRKTPSGVGYDDVGGTIEKWAKENPDDYVSFVTAVFKKDELHSFLLMTNHLKGVHLDLKVFSM